MLDKITAAGRGRVLPTGWGQGVALHDEHDSYVACLAETDATPLLVEQLHGPDQVLRAWAATGLRLLDTREARRALYQARANGQIG